MDHVQAITGKASERYLLGEMTEPERFAFEDHYFQCADCAEDVRAGAIMARGIQAVGLQDLAARPRRQAAVAEPATGRFWGWLTPASLIPAAAAVMLACVTGYQSLVTIPNLSGSRAMSPVVLRAAARGDEQTIDLHGAQPFSILSLDVNAAEPGLPLRYEITAEGRSPSITGSTTAPPPGSPLLITVPHSSLNRAGAWKLTLRKPDSSEIATYPFQLKTQ